MFNRKAMLSLFIFFFMLPLGSPVGAEEYSCWLVAPDQNDVWVIVYLADTDGNRLDPIWEGKLGAGQKKQIKCDTGHIRYDYTLEKGDPYEGDHSRPCEGQNEILIH